MVVWFTRLVLEARVSMRGASGVLKLMSEQLGYDEPVPHWTTGRKWLQRQGHAQLTSPLPQADDWAWLVDHTVQIGQEKCLVIVGIQLRNLPPAGTSLRLQDLHLVALVPRKSWTKVEVDEALEAAVARTAVPRVIVNDHGADVVRMWWEASEWQQVMNTAVTCVNQHGVYRGAVRDLKRRLPSRCQSASGRQLAQDLVGFVQSESRKARRGERLPGSTEIWESCFGKFKVLEREQSKGGFTSLVIAFGSLLMNVSQQTVTAALQHSTAQSVMNWCRQHLGFTLFSIRKIAYGTSATKVG